MVTAQPLKLYIRPWPEQAVPGLWSHPLFIACAQWPAKSLAASRKSGLGSSCGIPSISGCSLNRLCQVGEPALFHCLCAVASEQLGGIGEVQIDVFQVAAHPLESHLQLSLQKRFFVSGIQALAHVQPVQSSELLSKQHKSIPCKEFLARARILVLNGCQVTK